MVEKLIPYIEELVKYPEWVTFILSMLPITELRGSLPWAVLVGKLSWPLAIGLSIAGNLLVTLPILFFLEPISTKFRKWPIGDRFFTWLFHRTRKKGRLIEKLEFWGLVIFVGIPLPITGAWTGSVAAFIFGVSYFRSIMAILLGLIMSSSIVSALILSGQYMID